MGGMGDMDGVKNILGVKRIEMAVLYLLRTTAKFRPLKRRGSFTHPMLVTKKYLVRHDGHRQSHYEAILTAWPSSLVGFELGIFRFEVNHYPTLQLPQS